jgi:dihydroneopterin aldolase
MDSSSQPLDAVIVGAGPAGCSAASWAAQMGLRVAVVERAAEPCAALAGMAIAQDWVLGQQDVGRRLADHARRQAGVQWHLGTQVTTLERSGDRWQVKLASGAMLQAAALVLATGTRPVRPPNYFDTGAGVMDAAGLTAQRESLPPGRILLLGGGDNALENAAYLAGRGHQVTLWTRDDWRGQAHLVAGLAAHGSRIQQRRHTALPPALRPTPGGGIEAESAAFGAEHFDAAAVLFGYEPEPAPWDALNQALAGRHPTLRPGQACETLGVFVAGDASGRWHPCVQTALADGVQVAKLVSGWLGADAGARPPEMPKAPLSTLNSQILQLSGLRFGANLGVLDHERHGPQPIQVDAELNLGEQPALARDAGIGHVLDYRKVRQIIIDECTAEHTDLLESLLAKLCVRLMRLPGVLGVRIRVAKLEIFDDCEVAIRCEAGKW